MWNVVSDNGNVYSFFEAEETAKVGTIYTLQQFTTHDEALAAALAIDPQFKEFDESV